MLGNTFELRTDKKGDRLGRFPVEEWDVRTQQIKVDKLCNVLILAIPQRLEKVISLDLLDDEKITREKCYMH